MLLLLLLCRLLLVLVMHYGRLRCNLASRQLAVASRPEFRRGLRHIDV